MISATVYCSISEPGLILLCHSRLTKIQIIIFHFMLLIEKSPFLSFTSFFSSILFLSS